MMDHKKIFESYKGKKVFITGHTGFKGSWLTEMLLLAGAQVTGYSLEPPTEPSLFKLCGFDASVNERMVFPSGGSLRSIIADIRDLEALSKAMDEEEPEFVFHLAAQPIVRTSYAEPVLTYETNVMGTVNICESIRRQLGKGYVKSFLNVTTDKLYKNLERQEGYREDELLDGFDPYSNSKSCSELVTHSYINSFFGGNEKDAALAVSTARAGNVIGGGDFAKDRIIPDCVRALVSHDTLFIRNPLSTRPYEHVLEPLFAYLMIAAEALNDHSKAGFYNVGPDDIDCVNTGDLVKLFAKHAGDDFVYEIAPVDKNAPHEAGFLKLDNSLLKNTFGWAPKLHIDDAVRLTVEWTGGWIKDDSAGGIREMMDKQIKFYFT